jgi:hypothetical protein
MGFRKHHMPLVSITRRMVKLTSSSIHTAKRDDMNDMLAFAKRLRRAASAIEELFVEAKRQNRQTAFALTSHTPRFKKKAPNKGYSYNGKHWTQTPAGKKKMARIQKLAAAARRKNQQEKAAS